MEKYEKVRTLSKQKCSEVMVVRDIWTGEEWILKEVSGVEGGGWEAGLMLQGVHPHIIHLRETIEQGDHLNIIMEYAKGGDL